MTTRFQDLSVWQQAQDLAMAIYQATRMSGIEADYGLAGQMQRTATVIVMGIQQSAVQTSSIDFHRFLSIAKASCTEIKSQLHMARDLGFIKQPDFDTLLAQAGEVARQLNDLRAADCGVCTPTSLPAN